MVAEGGGPIRRFEVETGAEIEPLLSSRAEAIRVSPKGDRVAVFLKNELQIYDLASTQSLARCSLRADLNDIAWHPNGGILAVATSRGLYLWKPDGAPDEREPVLIGDRNFVSRAFFNSDGDLLFAGGWGDTSGIWDTRSGQRLLLSHDGTIVQLSRDNRQLIYTKERNGSGARGFVSPGALRRFLIPPSVCQDQGTSGIRYLPGNRWLVSAHARGLLLWDTTSGLVVRSLPVRSVASLDAFPNGKGLLTCGRDGVQLWPVDTAMEPPVIGPPQTLLPAEPWHFERAALSPDGKHIAAADLVGKHGVITDCPQLSSFRWKNTPPEPEPMFNSAPMVVG